MKSIEEIRNSIAEKQLEEFQNNLCLIDEDTKINDETREKRKEKAIREFSKNYILALADYRKGDHVGHNGDRYSDFVIKKVNVEFADEEMNRPEIVYHMKDVYTGDMYEATDDDLFLIKRNTSNR